MFIRDWGEMRRQEDQERRQSEFYTVNGKRGFIKDLRKKLDIICIQEA